MDDKIPFKVRIIGTVFIILSGVLLYLDKLLAILNIESNYTFGYSTFSNFIWAFMQSIAPIFMMLGVYFKPYKAAFLVAVYSYGLQLVWVFSNEHSDDFLGYVYAFGLCLIFILLVFIIKTLVSRFDKQKSKNEEFIIEAKGVLEIMKSKILENKIEGYDKGF